MSHKYQVSIHRSSSTSYMIKRLGGIPNIISCEKNDLFDHKNGTYYTVTIEDPSLITKFSKSYMRIKVL